MTLVIGLLVAIWAGKGQTTSRKFWFHHMPYERIGHQGTAFGNFTVRELSLTLRAFQHPPRHTLHRDNFVANVG
jgi:hypothetical protein